MRRIKKGFTLAEVLITLAIIGIVAAIVMPSVILNYQTKTLGIKLAKFAGSIENSARAYNASDSSLTDNSSINSFLREALVVKNMYLADDLGSSTSAPLRKSGFGSLSERTEQKGLTNLGITGAAGDDDSQVCKTRDGDGNCTEYYKATGGVIAVLKDNTRVMAFPIDNTKHTKDWETQHVVNKTKVGDGAFVLTFDPNVTGLAKGTQKAFDFVVTEFGFVFPSDEDTCLWDIANNDWTSTVEILANSHCKSST